MHKKGYEPKILKRKQYIYELVKDTNVEKRPDINVILTKYVEGLGNAGDEVTVKPNFAYNNLLLPGKAVYATLDNVTKYKRDDAINDQDVKYSSSTAMRVKILCVLTL